MVKKIYKQDIDWPDCTRLLQKMKLQVILLHTVFNLPDNYDAITDYRCEHNLFDANKQRG